MRKIYYIMSAAAVFLALISCKKEESMPQRRQTTIIAQTEDNTVTKASLSGNDATGYRVVWSEADQLEAIDDIGARHTFTLTEGAGTCSGVFSCDDVIPDGECQLIYGAKGSNLSRIRTYTGENMIPNAPMHALVSITDGQIPTTKFTNLCGLVRVTLKGNGLVKEIKISSNEPMSGPVLIQKDGTMGFVRNPHNDVTLSFGEGVKISPEGKSFYISLPPTDYTKVVIEIKDYLGNTITKTLKSDKTLSIERAQITPVNLSVGSLADKPDVEDAVLPGEFSVSSSKKVHFSKGNLMATKNSGSGYSWGFAANQYDLIGAKAGNTTILSQAAGSIVDLFCWSTPKTSYGICINTAYQCGGDFLEWGANIDDKGTWRTLSRTEWQYLLGNSTVRANKVGSATVGGFHGIIILPDSFTDPMRNNGSEAFVPHSDVQAWSANVYSRIDWEAMQTAGAVFLPATGWRAQDIYDSNKTEVQNVGVVGWYWSSTTYITEYYAYCVDFRESKISDEYYLRSYGCAVRLVTDSK